MAALLDDVRLGFRTFKRNPGHAAVVVTTLAVGIAACSVVFSILNAIAYRPYKAYRDPGRLVFLLEQNRRLGTVAGVSAPTLNAWRPLARSFEFMGGIAPTSAALMAGGEPETVFTAQVTEDFVRVLDGSAAAGRSFAASDFGAGSSTVMISHALWQRQFGASPHVVGRTLMVDGRSAIVVGVLNPRFTVKPFLGADPEIFVPLPATVALDRSARGLFVLARLKPGVSTSQARAEMETIAMRLAAAGPPDQRVDVYVKNPTELDLQGDAGFLVMLFAGVGFVLLIICANVMNLMFARAAGRTKEVATRLAIGARRAHVVRQLLVEASMLGLAGSAAAGLVAYWACRALSWFVAGTNIGSMDLRPDATVFAVTAVVTVGTTFVAAFAPAVRVARAPIVEALKENGTAGSQLSPGRFRRLIVSFEVALALVLLVSAGLVLERVVEVRHTNPGFRPDGLVSVLTTLPGTRYEEPGAKIAFADHLLARLKGRGELTGAAVTSFLPLSGAEVPIEQFAVEGRPNPDSGRAPGAGLIVASSDYFRTLGVPLRSGRAFTDGDRSGSLPVAVVNDRFVARWFEGRSPLGSRIQVAGDWRTIVGVVGDVRYFHLNVPPAPTIYVPLAQRPSQTLVVLARTRSRDPQALAPTLKAEIRALDVAQPVRGGRSMAQIMEQSMGGFDLVTMVVGVLAAIAVGLASLGIYGVVAYSVARRSKEIGIRVALGAAPRDILAHVLGEGIRLTIVGAVPGMLLAIAAGRLLASKLFRVPAVDPWVFALAGVFVLSTVVVASYVPARRAARVDPLVATRTE